MSGLVCINHVSGARPRESLRCHSFIVVVVAIFIVHLHSEGYVIVRICSAKSHYYRVRLHVNRVCFSVSYGEFMDRTLIVLVVARKGNFRVVFHKREASLSCG